MQPIDALDAGTFGDPATTLTVDAAPAGAGTSTWRIRLRAFAILCAVWLIPGLVGGFSLGVLSAGPDDVSQISLRRALAWQILAWLPWAAWTAVAIWLVRRLPFARGHWLRAVAAHVVACVLVVNFQIFWTVLLDRLFWPGGVMSALEVHIRNAYLRFADWEIVTYMAVLAAGIALDYFRRYRDGQLAAERLRAEMTHAQLTALRAQLNPHFLFNALNSVVSLMDRDVPAAQKMVVRLGELLRLSLSADEALVPLSRELNLVRQYLEIERTRFGDRLTIAFRVPDELLDMPVPNLLLQPLVENAIVHGVAPRTGAGEVSVEAERGGAVLVLRVRDNGVGLNEPPSAVRVADARSAGHGIGLGNTRARLAAMYGDAASITLRAGEGGGCVTEVRIPVREAMA